MIRDKGFLWYLVILLVAMGTLLFWFVLSSYTFAAEDEGEFISVSIRTNEQADYSSELKQLRWQVSLEIVEDVLRDILPLGTDLSSRLALFLNKLSAPIPGADALGIDQVEPEELDEPPEETQPLVIIQSGSGSKSPTPTPIPSPSADLRITKDDGVTEYIPGSTVTYTIVVTNNGPDSVTGATVNDSKPAQVDTWTWTCSMSNGASGCDGVTGSASDFSDTVDLPNGGVITYTVTANISGAATGNIENTASVTTPGGVTDPALGNNSATDIDALGQQADLRITKDDGVTEYIPGSTVTYTIVVTNNGPDSVTGATVNDSKPAQMDTWTWTCSMSNGASGCDGVTGSASDFSDTVDLPNGGVIMYTVTANISGAATGNIENTASVTTPGGVTDPALGNNSAIDIDGESGAVTIHIEIMKPTNGQVITDINETNFEAESWVGNSRQNGNGVDHVEFRIQSIGHTQTESVIRYCAFSGNDPCNIMDQSMWDSLSNSITYTLEARGCKSVGDCSNWASADFTVSK